MTEQFKAGALAILLSAAMAGCGTAPGMYVATPATAQTRSTWFGSRASEPEPSIDFALIRLSAENMGKYSLPGNGSGVPLFSANSSGPYKLGLQDVLRINVWGHPDFLPTLSAVSSSGVASVPLGRTINEDGTLFFPLVGALPAAGLTLSEFRVALTKALTKYIKDPQVDVDMAAFRSQRVFMAGEVKAPGVVPITDIPLKITDALAAVGGTTPDADLGVVQLTRAAQSFTIDLNRLYFGGELALNLTLQHGDVLTVPDRQARKVFLLGEVMQPKSYVLRRGRVSLAEVLADAGGPNPLSANAGEVFVMRLGVDGKPLVFQLDAREPVALLLADRFDVQARDLVYVNPTSMTHAVRIMNQYLPLLQGVSSVKQVGGF
ncbi:MAG: polysaccharide biosynthesis/export family protein [Rhodoferax sp.]|uniref:polysaccharide biosynthesis/export family protein n=1 Tax=Rhodoferax sp. TaxID=50421 RepID=UPI00260ED611|nr:polysaccharide biosynthesis/export family protein [Rhodoferax sp.]MDD5334852.1 polysaccharide biosynthesis/export family protein [Rhodoferax sp.]